MTKVYLSSTRLDLEAERQAVTDWLIAANFQPVHSYVATSETVRESCLEDIAGCDFLVLIVGHRYGHQPKDGNPENLSITCLEFRKAQQIGLPCLAFLRTSVPDVGLSDVNDPPHFALVQAFRNEVADMARPAEFKDKAELISALGAAVQRKYAATPKQFISEATSRSPRHISKTAETTPPEHSPTAANWWATLPGVLAALASLIAAIVGLAAAIGGTGKPPTPSTAADPSVATPASPATSAIAPGQSREAPDKQQSVITGDIGAHTQVKIQQRQ